MTTEQFKNLEIEYKLKCTFLHNNLEEFQTYKISGKDYLYLGYFAQKQHETAHVFRMEGRNKHLILGRQELSILDVFDNIDLKNPKI